MKTTTNAKKKKNQRYCATITETLEEKLNYYNQFDQKKDVKNETQRSQCTIVSSKCLYMTMLTMQMF